MASTGPIQIDIAAVLSSRLGTRMRYVPRFIVAALERLICQRELNALLANNYPKRSADFCDGVLKDLDVELDVRDAENLPADSRVIFVSNHPLGGLDGMAMIAWLTRHYGKQAYFVVNDLLMHVEPLRECFVPVNKHGAQSRGSVSALDDVLATDAPVVIYPAGLVSRLHDDGTIADLRWNKMAVNKAIATQRDIVPVHFSGTNSRLFYRLARLRTKLGIKFNFEMIMLPRELVRAHGARYTLTCGKPISWQSLRGGAQALAQADELRSAVYSLSRKNTNQK